MKPQPFLHNEATGGMLLILAAVLAMAWANTPFASAYIRVLDIQIYWGMTIHAVINDGLMTVFFLLATLEIRYEITQGNLASMKGMAGPGIAAFGGMTAPIAIYFAVTHNDAAAARGWAIPVATDIAFSLAVVKALGKHAHPSLRVFLTALAILDDLGAIMVIAIFYSHGITWHYVAGAALICSSFLVLRRNRIDCLWPYIMAGSALWVMVLASGVHATLAGVAMAVLVPQKVGQSLERHLAAIVSSAILPIFALANAGVEVRGIHLRDVLAPMPLGIILGLVFGKQIGVFGATMLGRAAGVVQFPPGMTVRALYGASILCGVGFTMSLFIGDLAFRTGVRGAEVKLSVLAASSAAAIAGYLFLRAAEPRSR